MAAALTSASFLPTVDFVAQTNTTDIIQSSPGVVRPARRPPGWHAPGPAPSADLDRIGVSPQRGEDLCFLVGDWRILQLVSGHRWSLDDLVTAELAAQGEVPTRALDLGCGIGSVLMMVAWSFPSVVSVGVEAQEVSAALARRSLRYNGCTERVRVLAGDFRSVAIDGGPFELITGTPPYFETGTHTVSNGLQRGPCRHELRGGVSDYLATARANLSEGGRVVVCFAHRQGPSVHDALAANGLYASRWRSVVPKTGREPLLDVIEARVGPPREFQTERLVVRDAEGQWTPEFARVRERMGLPPRL
ncbi:MAG: tRNA1(Val) A37 N6-methylase TrmN6 [Bradymonadia bacterium]|jgi:tRNA1(Val) A37 N6-methylase TrmN6